MNDVYRRDFATESVPHHSETSGYAARLVAEIDEVLRNCIREGMVPVGVMFRNGPDTLAGFVVTAVKCEVPENVKERLTP